MKTERGFDAERVFIVAEVGVNHNGDLEMARRLIDVAREAGADAVKFQTFRAARLVLGDAPMAEYQSRNLGTAELGQQEMLRRLEIDEAGFVRLRDHARSCGIEFFSTPFDLESVDILERLNVNIIKIPSGEITNLPYLTRIGATGRRLILSTGMSTLGEIEAALGALEAAGAPRSEITVLHASTDYPPPVEEVNLRAMQTIREAFQVRVGYSDHTLGPEVAVAAVALGARVIEKHITLDKNLPGPDHRASAEPEEFVRYVQAIRKTEAALGSPLKRPAPGESKNRAVARKSIVAATRIAAGEEFTESNLTTKRPGTGMSPMRWHEIVGRRAAREFAADEPIVI